MGSVEDGVMVVGIDVSTGDVTEFSHEVDLRWMLWWPMVLLIPRLITSHLCGDNEVAKCVSNYINPGYGLSLVDTLWNASSYRQPLEQEGNAMT